MLTYLQHFIYAILAVASQRFIFSQIMTQYMLLLLFIVYNVKGEMKNSAEPHFTTLINASVLEDSSQYSFPPNNTPVTKVYVFGRPVYIRQPFVLPQRNRINEKSLIALHGTSAYGSLSMMNDESVFPHNRKMPVKPNETAESAIIREELAKEIFYPLPSPDRFQYPKPKTIFRDSYNFEPEPYIKPKNNYPLPQCYTNDSGFMCCNAKLEQVMKDVFNELASSGKWHSCNVQQIANKLQNTTQSIFKTDFEALAGIGDFASKTHFYSDLICKIEVQGRFMLSYATPNRHQPPKYPTSAPNPYETPTIEPTKPYKN